MALVKDSEQLKEQQLDGQQGNRVLPLSYYTLPFPFCKSLDCMFTEACDQLAKKGPWSTIAATPSPLLFFQTCHWNFDVNVQLDPVLFESKSEQHPPDKASVIRLENEETSQGGIEGIGELGEVVQEKEGSSDAPAGDDTLAGMPTFMKSMLASIRNHDASFMTEYPVNPDEASPLQSKHDYARHWHVSSESADGMAPENQEQLVPLAEHDKEEEVGAKWPTNLPNQEENPLENNPFLSLELWSNAGDGLEESSFPKSPVTPKLSEEGQENLDDSTMNETDAASDTLHSGSATTRETNEANDKAVSNSDEVKAGVNDGALADDENLKHNSESDHTEDSENDSDLEEETDVIEEIHGSTDCSPCAALNKELMKSKKKAAKFQRMAVQNLNNVTDVEDELEKEIKKSSDLRKRLNQSRAELRQANDLALRNCENVTELEEEVEEKDKEILRLRAEVEEVKHTYREALLAGKENRKRVEAELEKMTDQVKYWQHEVQHTRDERKAEIIQMDASYSLLFTEVTTYRNLNIPKDRKVNFHIEAMKKENTQQAKQIRTSEKNLSRMTKSVEDLQMSIHERDVVRGELHHRIEQLNAEKIQMSKDICELRNKIGKFLKQLGMRERQVKDLIKLLNFDTHTLQIKSSQLDKTTAVELNARHIVVFNMAKQQTLAKIEAEIMVKSEVEEMKAAMLKLELDRDQLREEYEKQQNELDRLALLEEMALAQNPQLLRQIADQKTEIEIRNAKIAKQEHFMREHWKINCPTDAEVKARMQKDIKELETELSQLRARQEPLEREVAGVNATANARVRRQEHSRRLAEHEVDYWRSMYFNEAVTERERLLKEVVVRQVKLGEKPWTPIEPTKHEHDESRSRNMIRVARQIGYHMPEELYPDEGKEGQGPFPATIEILRQMGGPHMLVYLKGMPFVKRYPHEFKWWHAKELREARMKVVDGPNIRIMIKKPQFGHQPIGETRPALLEPEDIAAEDDDETF